MKALKTYKFNLLIGTLYIIKEGNSYTIRWKGRDYNKE
jgi:hypothetical protein